MIENIAGYDVDIDLEEGDTITDVIVLARVQRFDTPGMSALIIGSSEHTDGIIQTGLIHSAVALIGVTRCDEDDD